MPASESDQANVLKILSVTVAALVVAIFIARQVTKAIIFRKVRVDDCLIFSASLFAIGLSATTFILAVNHLGSPAPLTLEQSDIVSKGHYAFDLLYIFAVCFPKLSILVLFYTIAPAQRFIRHAALILGLIVIAWTLTSLVVIAVECELPNPWRTFGAGCIDTGIFWIVYSVLDILSELAILALSVNIAISSHLQLSRKIAIVACFTPRLLVVATVVLRLIWLSPLALQDNIHFRTWKIALISQIQVVLSIATASMPFMMPFFKGLGSRMQQPGSSKPSMNPPNGETGRTKPPLWFRRQQKSKDQSDWKPASSGAAGYELLPKAPLRNPSIGSIAPLTPRLQYSTERKSSIRGLIIRVPHRESLSKQGSEFLTPRTHSSGLLSAMNASSEALLLPHSFIPSRKAPNPPSKMRRLSPPTPGSWLSSRSPPLVAHTPQKQRFSLFPSQKSTPSRVQPSKLSTKAPLTPQLPSLSTFNKETTRRASTNDLTSPMGTAIEDWFSTAETEPHEQSSVQPPTSSQDARESNGSPRVQSLDMPMYPLVSHTRSPAGASVFFDELSPPHDPYYTPWSPEETSMPLVRDVRNHPRVVFRNVLQ